MSTREALKVRLSAANYLQQEDAEGMIISSKILASKECVNGWPALHPRNQRTDSQIEKKEGQSVKTIDCILNELLGKIKILCS